MKPSLILSLILASAAHAQIFTPKDIDLSVSFSNVNPAVTSAMSSPGGPGLKRVLVTATTFPAPAEGARQALKDYVATGPLAAPAIFTVDDTVGGLTYAAQVLAELHSGQQYYFPRATAGLNTAGANPAWSIADTASLVNFQFVDSVGAPVAVNGGIILANDPDITDTAPSNLYLADGATGAAFLARGGSHTTFAVYVDLGGTDAAATKYRKKYTVENYAITAIPSDTVQTVTIVIDAAANTSGSLSGRFDVTQSAVSANEAPSTNDGFFEIYAPTPPNDSHPDYPILRTTFNAGDGYGNWDRDTSFLGTNFSSEASGAFTSANLLPSPAPAEGSYNVYGETFLRRSISGDPAGMHRLQFLRTPWLGGGSNPAAQIPAGNFDTADTFVINPGYLTGSVTLAGPDVIAAYPALLAHVVRSTDDDTNGDGLPDSPITDWFNGSVIRANGLDTLATGATLTASGGQSFVPLPGSFNPSSGDFTGHYHFALGGLNGESAFWQANTTSLRFYNPGTSANTYFFTDFSLTDRTSEVTLRREMAPDATRTADISHEFGEVSLRIRATSGTIYQPQIRNVTDDPTKPLNPIAVSDFLADGWPNTQADAATTATVRCLIPAGTWVLTPRINPGDQAPGASIDLVPISIEVPARGRIGFETEFLMNTSIPACLSGSTAAISGTITSTGSLVTEIRYSIDGGTPIVISTPNSLTPSFSIDLSALADGPHRIVITATGAGGEEAFVDSTFHHDAVGLTIQKAVILTWGCGVLQTSTDMENWTDVTGATSPFAVPTDEPKRFWQVRYE
jgi:hypothetical protein